jgi:uncharacterized protein YggE
MSGVIQRTIREVIMTVSGRDTVVAFAAAVFLVSAAAAAQAQQPALPDARVIVTGEGSVTAPPDYAEIRSGVTTRAKTAKEATDANSKAMAAVTAALLDAGVERKDIQTEQFSVQPVYAPQQANTAPQLDGFAVSNQVRVAVRQLDKLGDILDRLVTAGATDIGGVTFLHADLSKALDGAREAAMADARRKAALYAHAAGLTLGGVLWVTEDPAYAPPLPMARMRAAVAAAPVPIAAGEDTLRAQVTVGFDVAH